MLDTESLSESSFEPSVSELDDDTLIKPDKTYLNIDFDTEDDVIDNDLPINPSIPSSPQNISLNETDPNKPDRQNNHKLTRVSAIRSGLKGLNNTSKPWGLFKFWKKGTEEDKNQFFAREDERHNEWMEQNKDRSDRKKHVEIDTKQECARLQKQKSRARKRESSLRNQDGTKNLGKKKRYATSGLVKCNYYISYANQVINIQLADLPAHKTRSSIAELTRPARALKKKIKAENKKPQGRKKMKTTEDAKYHNWFNPFTWSLIEKASRNAGWEMSASAIVREAKRIDAVIFTNLSQTTVIGWIDHSGDMPRWTNSVLQCIERGNDPGHKNGGRLGILVSQQSFKI